MTSNYAQNVGVIAFLERKNSKEIHA